MLTLEQITHFQNCFTRAKKIICTPIDSDQKRAPIKYHIRVSGRQAPNGQWSVGFIFGVGNDTDWLKIADVPTNELASAKHIYRSMLHDLISIK
ncbi:hypothetical protein ACVOZ6_003459 [Escherichia coli]